MERSGFVCNKIEPNTVCSFSIFSKASCKVPNVGRCLGSSFQQENMTENLNTKTWKVRKYVLHQRIPGYRL